MANTEFPKGDLMAGGVKKVAELRDRIAKGHLEDKSRAYNTGSHFSLVLHSWHTALVALNIQKRVSLKHLGSQDLGGDFTAVAVDEFEEKVLVQCSQVEESTTV